MTPRVFLENVARPNLAEFSTSFADLRLAMNAVHSIDALAAHIYSASGGAASTGCKDDSAFRAQLAATSLEFALLRDVAKALKHVELTRVGKSPPALTRAAQVGSQSLGWDEGNWEEVRWDSPPQVVVETDLGETRALDAICASALAFLESEMAARGL